MLHRCYCVEASVNYLNYKRNMSWWMDGRVVIRILPERKMSFTIRYIIQCLSETDLEEMIVNIIQQGYQ
jgi:hypothetical protein